MIAKAVILIYPLLGAIPFVAALLLRSLPGQEKEKAWLMVLCAALPFALWQWALNLVLYSGIDWIFMQRLVDPLFLGVMLAGVLRAENGISGVVDTRYLKFLLAMLPWLLGNTAVQAFTLSYPDKLPLLSILSIFILSGKMVGAYGRFTIRPRIRQRISIILWVVSAAVPLPFFRVFFLGHLAYIWWGRLRQQVRIIHEESRARENEKKVISRISETLTAVIQDVGNFQQSMLNYLKGLCDSLEVKSGAVYLWDSQEKCYRLAQVHGLFFPLTRGVEHSFMREKALHELLRSTDITNSGNLVWECGQSRKPIHLAYASQDPRIQKLGERGNNIQTLVLVPLLLEHELLGVLVLQNKSFERYFSESDAYLIYTFAHYATLMVNASRMLKDRAERERVQNELQLGQRIQSDLLPRHIPIVDGIELAGSMIPAKEIGGDYYDFIQADNNRLGIAIGDVSGKGVPAGMLMTILQTLLHAQYRYFNNTKDLLVDINTSLSMKIKSSMFITFLLFEWNSQEKSLKYTACGHEHILHYNAKARRLDCFRAGGIALGMTDDNSAIIRERVLPVGVDDTILLYSDGIIEARNQANEMYGLDRLKAFVERNEGNPAETIRSRLMDELDRFRHGEEQVDDITCIVMRF